MGSITTGGAAGKPARATRRGRKLAGQAAEPRPDPAVSPRLVGTTAGPNPVCVSVDYPPGTRNGIADIPPEAHRLTYCRLLVAIRAARELQGRQQGRPLGGDGEPALALLFPSRMGGHGWVWETRPNGLGETGLTHAEMLKWCVDGFYG